ncbi:MAG: DNA-directed RNA polymerase subunit alpha [Candidatus Cloacimonetes bacterium]|nr:DNA-directed RNA polymerase subunit alpha [Candidatus Cloacimonadota bacterium]
MMLLEPLQLPTKIDIDKDTYSSTYGKFEIGPFEAGYATTIGNTLRRVLLSSIQGTAAKFVKIEGLHHEFTPIPGCDSDYVDFILNLKKLVFKSDTLNEVKLTLHHKGVGPETAEEIEETSEVKVINKELVLCNMTEDTELFVEIWVGQGRGYTPADEHDIEDKPVGVIPVDSIYSPITKVNFVTANQRVGERIDFDKLIVEIYTNGSIEPKDSLYLSAKLLKDLYSTLVQFEEEPDYVEEVEMDPELERLEKVLAINVKELELTVRSANCLSAAKIETIGDLVSKTEQEMLKFRNFGKKSLEEIKKLTTTFDLTLGMDVDSILKKIEDAKNRMINIKKG